jgi:hypothetical protein
MRVFPATTIAIIKSAGRQNGGWSPRCLEGEATLKIFRKAAGRSPSCRPIQLQADHRDRVNSRKLARLQKILRPVALPNSRPATIADRKLAPTCARIRTYLSPYPALTRAPRYPASRKNDFESCPGFAAIPRELQTIPVKRVADRRFHGMDRPRSE